MSVLLPAAHSGSCSADLSISSVDAQIVAFGDFNSDKW
jgi:hypothetical protein